ncbi:MAG: FlgD immunoglobulin-like domain containing protein, partial [Candidatus Cloacimonadales bacterium]|nr:FlgD immunoglobulin-like domain containing protein [Candidatus Cloacimonadales bacterium]
MKKSVLFVLFVLALGCLSAQWSSDPLENNAICDLTGEQAIPKVVNGPTGDTYIGYFSNDSGNYDVRLQRLDSQGNELWAHNGILISDNPAMTWLTDWDMTVDQDNHAVLAFQDIRNAGNNNVYAYRIAPDGTFVWGSDGLELSNTTAFDVSPKLAVTSTGNIVVAWQAETISILQKIAPDGTLLWGTTGITISSVNTISWPQPFTVDNDEILVKYFDDSGPAWAPTRHCFMQKYDTDGNAVWATPTVVSNAGGITAWTQVFNIISDENNGCFITWHDSRGGGTISYPFTQHVNADGSVAFTANGVQLSTETNRQNFYPESVYNAVSNELTIYWSQTDGDQNNHGITGQKLDAGGALLWSANGQNIIPVSALYVLPFAVRAAEDDVIIIYEEFADAVNEYVKAMRLDSDGNFVWPGDAVTMCSVLSSKVHSEASQFAQNQFIAAWEDDRNGSSDIIAQNINFDGTLGPAAETGTIEGTVTLVGGVGNIEEVLVSAGTYICNPDINGNFSISLPAGTYDIEVSLEYYTTVSGITIEVTAGSITTIDGINLIWIPVFNPPQNLIVDPFTGLITWDPPEPYPGAVLIGYNVFLDDMTTPIGTTASTEWQYTYLINGQLYAFGISAVYDLGESEIVVVEFTYTGTGVENNLISVTELSGNYPNPFNPTTTIAFSLKEDSQVILEVYNVKGESIKQLVSDQLSAGQHSVVWNGTDNSGKPVSSGIYFYKLRSKNFSSTRKMILM